MDVPLSLALPRERTQIGRSRAKCPKNRRERNVRLTDRRQGPTVWEVGPSIFDSASASDGSSLKVEVDGHQAMSSRSWLEAK